MKRIIKGSNLRAYFINLPVIPILWIVNVAQNYNHAESWDENFKHFPYLTLHITLPMLSFFAIILAFAYYDDRKCRIKITDKIIVGPKGYALWNEGKYTMIKREEKFEIKKGIFGGWITSTRIVQGKKKLKLDPNFFSKKKIDIIIQTINNEANRTSSVGPVA
jgi:hypothetical protein